MFESTFQLLQLHWRELIVLDLGLPVLQSYYSHHVNHLSLLLLGLPVATTALMVPVVNVAFLVAFVVDVAFMVHVIHEVQISFLNVAFFGLVILQLHVI